MTSATRDLGHTGKEALNRIVSRHVQSERATDSEARMPRRLGSIVSCFALLGLALCTAGTAAPAPAKVGAQSTSWKSGLHVDLTTRESSRTFYRAIYQASVAVPSGWNGNTDAGIAGTTSQAFRDAKLLRIKWFRAMAGVPTEIAFR